MRSRDRVIPNLVAPLWVNRAFLWGTGLALLVWLLATAATWGVAGGAVAIALAFCTLVLGGVLISFTYSRFLICFPIGCETIGDLVRVTVPPEIPPGQDERLAVEQAVLLKIRQITAEQMGLELDKVQASSRFVEDLQVD